MFKFAKPAFQRAALVSLQLGIYALAAVSLAAEVAERAEKERLEGRMFANGKGWRPGELASQAAAPLERVETPRRLETPAGMTGEAWLGQVGEWLKPYATPDVHGVRSLRCFERDCNASLHGNSLRDLAGLAHAYGWTMRDGSGVWCHIHRRAAA